MQVSRSPGGPTESMDACNRAPRAVASGCNSVAPSVGFFFPRPRPFPLPFLIHRCPNLSPQPFKSRTKPVCSFHYKPIRQPSAQKKHNLIAASASRTTRKKSLSYKTHNTSSLLTGFTEPPAVQRLPSYHHPPSQPLRPITFSIRKQWRQ